MRTTPLSPEAQARQTAAVSRTMKEKHRDPAWHADWLAKTRAHHKRRKELVDEALALLAKRNSETT